MKFKSLLAFLFLGTFVQAQSLTLRTFYGATHQAIQFTSPQKGFALAYADTLGALPEGVLRKTIDGGVTWKTFPITFSPTLPDYPGVNTVEVRNNLQMLNENVGYCAGELNTNLGSQGMILKTNNGGISWTGTPIPVTNLPIQCIYFTNETTGYFAADDIYKTTNSGATWSKVMTLGGSIVQTIYFLNETTGFACASNKIFKTTNAGLNWEKIDLPGGVRPSSMRFISNTAGFFTTETNGRIYGTTDGGANWNLLYSEMNTRLTSISVINNVIVVGGYSTTSSTCNTFIVKSDNGVNWIKECFNFEFPNPRYVYSTYFIAEDKGFLGVDGGLYEYSTQLLPQTIIGFNPIPNLNVGESYTITGVTGGGSGNPIVFTSSNTAIATVSGNVITALASGNVTITASQAGNATYAAATSVSQNLVVNTLALLPQTIIGFNPIPNLSVGESYTITGVTGGGSGNPIVFTSSNTAIATVSGNVITALASGNVTITASQAGNATYAAATSVSQNLTIDAVLSVENPLSTETQITLYPNPTKDILFIKILATSLPKEINIELFNTKGQMVKRYKEKPNSNNQLIMDISDFSEGVYFLNFSTEKLNCSKKIVIVR